MKTEISAQHLVHFSRHGHVRFDNFQADFEMIKKLANKEKRDSWRNEPTLKKLIVQRLAPLAFNLTKNRAIHLACDQWIDFSLHSGPMKNLFCFQNIACIFVISENNTLDVYEPSSLTSQVQKESYLVVFTKENGILIDNPKDPYAVQTRNLGYVYGDRLKNELHPLIVR